MKKVLKKLLKAGWYVELKFHQDEPKHRAWVATACKQPWNLQDPVYIEPVSYAVGMNSTLRKAIRDMKRNMDDGFMLPNC